MRPVRNLGFAFWTCFWYYYDMKLEMLALSAALAVSCALSATGDETFSREDFRIRDPFVLPDGDTYYLYESKPWNGGHEVWVRTSKDLEKWSDRTLVTHLPEDVKCTAVWAPEVHKYAGKYWLFTTLSFAPDPAKPIRPMLEKGFKGGKLLPRGVWVFKSDSPKGPFTPVKLGSVTPEEWMCLDGTLWVEGGKPWMVFCHEWCQTGNGRMMAAPLAEDLTCFAAEPVELFRANVIPGGGHVTDGPFLVRPDGAGLRMIWSNGVKGSGYSVIQCKSMSGKVTGPWGMHSLLFRGDGGHGMVFKRFDGQLMLTLHQPNGGEAERMKVFPLGVTWEGLSRIDWDPFGPEWRKQWTPEFERTLDARIEKCRKADATVDGLPAGAEVKVDQLTSKFLFGSNMFNFDQLGSDAMNAEYRAAFTNLFNAATIAFYWKEFEPDEGKPRFTSGPRDLPAFWNAFDFEKDDPYAYVEWRRPAPDRLIAFCRENGVAIHGHAMIYSAWSPDWLWEKSKTPEIAAECHARRISELGRHYGDTVGQWDVVNESLNRLSTKENPDDAECWYTMNKKGKFLPREVTLNAFRTAAASFPSGVRLAINDAWTMQNDAYAAFVKKLIRQGAKIDVIGYQKHIFRPANLLTVASGYPCFTNSQTWNLDEDERRLRELDEIGLPIHISEITIPSPRGLAGLTDGQADEIQAKVMRAYYRFWFSWPSVDRITYWNLVDGVGAKKERMSSGWYNRDMTKKRVWHVMNDLINREWRTHLTAKADADGRVAFRGFKGSYRVAWKDADGRERTKTVEVK